MARLTCKLLLPRNILIVACSAIGRPPREGSSPYNWWPARWKSSFDQLPHTVSANVISWCAEKSWKWVSLKLGTRQLSSECLPRGLCNFWKCMHEWLIFQDSNSIHSIVVAFLHDRTANRPSLAPTIKRPQPVELSPGVNSYIYRLNRRQELCRISGRSGTLSGVLSMLMLIKKRSNLSPFLLLIVILWIN